MRLGPEFDEFARDASPALLRTAYLLCGDRGHAEDLLQTAPLRTAGSPARSARAASLRTTPAATSTSTAMPLSRANA